LENLFPKLYGFKTRNLICKIGSFSLDGKGRKKGHEKTFLRFFKMDILKCPILNFSG
jgi:hypothetical protein